VSASLAADLTIEHERSDHRIDLGKMRHCSSEKARRDLGWAPRDKDEALVATAESLEKYGLLK
jgi:nucleoside-diphosphate-sugar epimerase